MPDREDRAAFGLLLAYGLGLGLPGPAAPSLQSAFGLGYTGAALHLTLFSVGAWVGSALAGRLGGAVPRRRLAYGALSGLAAGGVAVAGAPAVQVSLAGAALMGVFGVVAVNVGQGAIGERHGAGSAAILSAGHVVSAVGLVAAALVVAGARASGLPGGWRLAFLAPLAAVGVLALTRQPDHLPPRAPGRGRRAGSGTATHRPSAAQQLGAAVVGLSVAVEWAVTFWAAAYLRDVVGLPARTADLATVLAFGGLVLGRVAVARLARARPARQLLRTTLVVVLVASVPFLAGPPIGGPVGSIAAVGALAVLCLAVAALFPLALALTMALADDGVAGSQERASASALGAGAVTGAAVPFGLGAVADATSLGVALLAVPAGALLAVLLMVAAQRSAAAATAPP